MVKKSKRPALSRARVLRTALRLADKSGLESLSMRKLASELKVEAMSLYNHVANKDDILDGLVELVVAKIEPPSLDVDWRVALRERAHSAYAALSRHPWATLLFMSRVNIGPKMLHYVDATLGCLLQAGFTHAEADHAWNAVDNHIYGFTLQEQNFPFEPGDYAAVAKQYLDLIPAQEYPALNALTHEVIEGRHAGVHDLDFGLDLILEGLERLRKGR